MLQSKNIKIIHNPNHRELLLCKRILVLTYLPNSLLYCSSISIPDTTIWTGCCSLNTLYFLCPLYFLFLECFPYCFPYWHKLLSRPRLNVTSLWSHPLLEAPPTLTLQSVPLCRHLYYALGFLFLLSSKNFVLLKFSSSMSIVAMSSLQILHIWQIFIGKYMYAQTIGRWHTNLVSPNSLILLKSKW